MFGDTIGDRFHALSTGTGTGGSPLPPITNAGPHSAGWLSWFVIGAVALIIGLAWFCLRGYRDSSSGE